MNPDYERHKQFSRRAVLLGTGSAALMSVLVGRLYFLQVIEAKKYATLAEENRINLRLIPPPRGRILDRYATPLAINEQSFQVEIIAEKVNGDVHRTLAELASIIDLSDDEIRRVLRDVDRHRDFVPVTVRENLGWDEVARIEVNAPDLPGIRIQQGRVRTYPFDQIAAHALGHVGAVTESEQTGDPLLQLPDFRIGKSGIERYYDKVLRGKAGTAQVEVNAHGRIIRELSRTDAVPGADVPLTIDIGLQRAVTERLGDKSAIAVVMDARHGEVLALASSPSFNPGAFADRLDPSLWQKWRTDPRKPLIDKAIAGQYAPGSVFKLCVALAALEAGTITPAHTVTCYGYVTLGSAVFHCWKHGGHGTLDLKEGIKQSCDVYFYDVARRTGIDRIAAMARRLGLGAPTGVDLPGERAGFIPTREWKQATLGEPWQGGETLVAGIGQGYVLTTPVQLAVMMSRLVNGGRAVTPHLSRAALTPDGLRPRPARSFPSLKLSPDNLSVLHDAMYGVVNEPHGTARIGRLDEPGMSMGGKTGTSQVRRISRAERATGVKKNEDLPWNLRDNGLFIGFGPTEDPRYVVAVVLEHGGSSHFAVPIARDIMRETLTRDPLNGRTRLQAKRGVQQDGG